MPDGHPASPHLAHHFDSLEKQAHAARLGMWMFLGTEVLLFAGLFVGYSYYRVIYTETFIAGSRHLSVGAGTLNTLILVSSSFAAAMGLHHARTGKRFAATLALAITIVLALCFLGVKAWEYHEHFTLGDYPGRWYRDAAFEAPGASLFFSFYYLMTGLHAIHVTVGIGVLSWLGVRVMQAAYGPEYDTPLELGCLYWHLVDIIWIFLYPLLYLV